LGLKAYSAKLDLADAPETLAFRAFEQVLKDDEKLAAAVRTWSTFRGDDTDLVMVPVAAECPFVRLSGWPSESRWETERQHRMTLVVRIGIAVVGTNSDNLMNLSSAIRRALFPQDNTGLRDAIQAALMNAQVSRPEITLNAYGVQADKDGVPINMGEGTYQFVMLIGT
jgi:hypothetical protein